MAWMLSEICDKISVKTNEFGTIEEAFDAMCDRISWLTKCDVDEMKNEVHNNILWNDNTVAGWCVVCKTFAWLKGERDYDWDIKVV
jgi:hypothetical protein